MAKTVFRPAGDRPPHVASTSWTARIPGPTRPPESSRKSPRWRSTRGRPPTTCAARPRLFKADWDKEKEAMIASARAEADAIVKKAEAAAFEEVKRRTTRPRS